MSRILHSLSTDHGTIHLPVFMPVATRGSIKGVLAEEVKAEIVLSNIYHLMQRPGIDVIKKAGGLHKFMGWDKPILTDSGGFQVFSLGKLRKIYEDRVEFISELNGKKIVLTPEGVIKMQKDLGVDIAMLLDVCTPYPCSYEEAEQAVRITTNWARKSKKIKLNKGQKFFAIFQGSTYRDLRERSIKELLELDFDGYAIGGECQRELYKVLDWICPLMPEDKPLYLMGIGKPRDIREAVKRGVNMFDCVLPAREARHGRLYISEDKYINILNNKFKNDFSKIAGVSKAYLHHLFKIEDPLGQRLATLHNIDFLLGFMKRLGKVARSLT